MRATILRANALSCLCFGTLFSTLPTTVAGFLGDPPQWLVLVLGVTLILNGLHLAWASLRRTSPLELHYFAVGDFLWVLATALMITSGIWITTAPGIAAAATVGLIVATFGILQWRIANGQATSGAEA